MVPVATARNQLASYTGPASIPPKPPNTANKQKHIHANLFVRCFIYKFGQVLFHQVYTCYFVVRIICSPSLSLSLSLAGANTQNTKYTSFWMTRSSAWNVTRQQIALLCARALPADGTYASPTKNPYFGRNNSLVRRNSMSFVFSSFHIFVSSL